MINAAKGQTAPISVANPAFLLERLAADCAPMQEYREITRNAIDAISRRCANENRAVQGHVLWDVDWPVARESRVFKLCCIDDGTGMSANDIERYINRLSSSANTQGLDANFGIGARITAGHKNPAGLYYFSWQGAAGVFAHFWRDDAAGAYGLRLRPRSDGTWATVIPAPDGTKPEEIDGWGTKVVLGGQEDEQHTVVPPELRTSRGALKPAPGGMKWLTIYLNRRFFRFPSGITVRVRELSSTDPQKWPVEPATSVSAGAQLRTVEGAKHHLDANAEDGGSGSVELDGATVHWWLLKQFTPSGTRTLSDSRQAWESRGHVAALYQDELYELRQGLEGGRFLKMFGITFGFDRVVLYVEHATGPGRSLSSNTARNALRLNGDELPWTEWAAEFRTKIPAALRRMMDDLLAASGAKDHLEAIKRRLQTIEDFLRVERYKRVPKGTSRTAGDALGGETNTDGDTSGGGGGRGGAGTGGRRGNLYGTMLDPEGDLASPTTPRLDAPNVVWASRQDGTRAEGEMEDRAASYTPETHELKINADFRVFASMKRCFIEEVGDAPGGEEIVKEVVHEWVEQQLVEAVMGVRTTLEGNKLWAHGSAELQRALSDEALTVAVMPRYHMITAIRRQVKGRLQQPRPARVAEEAP